MERVLGEKASGRRSRKILIGCFEISHPGFYTGFYRVTYILFRFLQGVRNMANAAWFGFMRVQRNPSIPDVVERNCIIKIPYEFGLFVSGLIKLDGGLNFAIGSVQSYSSRQNRNRIRVK